MIRFTRYLIILIWILYPSNIVGQNASEKVPIIKLLEQLSQQHAVIFNYESGALEQLQVYPFKNRASLNEQLKFLEKQTGLRFNKVSESIYTIIKPITICGYLQNVEDQAALFGAFITSSESSTISSENGYFELRVSTLDAPITIRHLGFKPVKRKAGYFKLDECPTIYLTVQNELIAPVVLEAYLVQGVDKRQDGATTIDYRKFSLLPGLIEADVLQSVQELPGILSADETVSNISIRGGSHDQNLILWDGIKMYQSGHFFGLISSFNPNITQKASIVMNGTDAALTDGVSGTIQMETSQDVNENFEGKIGVNFINAELFTSIPLGPKSSVELASRKSINSLLNTPTYQAYFDRVTQNTEADRNSENLINTNKEFDFYDASLRYLYQPNDNDRLKLNFILINNLLSFDEGISDLATGTSRRSSVSQNSIAFGLYYSKQWNSNFQSAVHLYNTDYKLEAINADVLLNQLFLQENSVSETGFKLNNSFFKEQWKFNVGVDLTETEIINLNDIDIPRFVRRDEEVLREYAVFGQIENESKQLNINSKGGIRVNYLPKFNRLLIEPRIALNKSLGEFTQLELLGEFKHQNSSQIVNFQNDFLGIEKRRWQLTDNDSIPILRSRQASLGVRHAKRGWLVDASIFYKKINGITTQSQSFTTKYEFTRERGSYEAYGFEFLFRKKYKNLSTWLSYAFLDNTYTFDELVEQRFNSNFDITHSVNLGSTLTTDKWKVSAGLNYRTGIPSTTPLLNTELASGMINFDQANNSRLEDYFRIDASAVYTFRLSNTFNSEIGISLWNISNESNPINNFYRLNENQDILKFSRFSLGLTTNAMFRIFF